MNSDQSEPPATGPRLISPRRKLFLILFFLWFATLGIHVGWYTESVITERQVLSIEPGVTLTIRTTMHPGTERSIGIPYFLLLSKESLPRSLTVVIDAQGLEHDSQVSIERIMATQDSPESPQVFEDISLPVKDALGAKLIQRGSSVSGYQSPHSLTDPVTRLSHTLANAITSEGVVYLEFFVSTKNGDQKAKSSPPQPVKFSIQQRQNFCIVLGWQSLLYSQL